MDRLPPMGSSLRRAGFSHALGIRVHALAPSSWAWQGALRIGHLLATRDSLRTSWELIDVSRLGWTLHHRLEGQWDRFPQWWIPDSDSLCSLPFPSEGSSQSIHESSSRRPRLDSFGRRETWSLDHSSGSSRALFGAEHRSKSCSHLPSHEEAVIKGHEQTWQT